MRDLLAAIRSNEFDEIESYYNTHPHPIHPDASFRGMTLLGEAISGNRFEIANLLLKNGANPNKPTASMPGLVPNHIFFLTPMRAELFELLLSYGADPNAVNMVGPSAGEPFFVVLY